MVFNGHTLYILRYGMSFELLVVRNYINYIFAIIYNYIFLIYVFKTELYILK